MKYQVSSDPIKRLSPMVHADGWKTFEVTATGTGILEYADPTKEGGIRYELRHPADVFHPDSLETLAGIPVTDLHPSVGRVDQDNRLTLQKGTVHTKVNSRFSADAKTKTKEDQDLFKSSSGLVDIVVTVHDKNLLTRMDSADVINNSMGYDCAMLPVSGTWHGRRFDCIQKNIVYNHSAILCDVAGRHPDAKAHVDSAGDKGILDIVSFFDNGKPETFGDTKILKVDQAALESLTHYDSLTFDDKELKSEIDILRSDSRVPVSYFFIDRAKIEPSNRIDNQENETMPTENTMKIAFGDAELQVSADQYTVLDAVKTKFDARIASLTKAVEEAETRADEAETEAEKLQGRYDGLEYDKNQLDVEVQQLREDASKAKSSKEDDEDEDDDKEMVSKEDAKTMAVTMAEDAMALCAKADSLGFTLSPKNAINHADRAMEQITSVYRDRLVQTGRFDAAELATQPLETLELLAKGASTPSTKSDSTDLSTISNLAGSNPGTGVPASFSDEATTKLREANSQQFGKGFTTLADLQGRKI